MTQSLLLVTLPCLWFSQELSILVQELEWGEEGSF